MSGEQQDPLSTLVALKQRFGRSAARDRLAALDRLAAARLETPRQVLALHEALCYARAYPDGPEVLSRAEALLAGFSGRGDLRRFRRDLGDTGIAGTDLFFRFYWLMAIRLAERWPDSLSVDWADFERAPDLVEMLHLLLTYTESPGLDEYDMSARDWVRRLKSSGETDAAFLIRRFAALDVPRPVREHLYEKLDIPMRISLDAGGPARSHEKWPRSPVVFQGRALRRGRPSLRRTIREARFRVRRLPESQGRELIELANAAMVPRHRDLLIFLHGDPRDVRLVDFGDGLQFACIGARPERRLLLEAVYGFLTLKNGVPIGYVLNSALFNSCELAYNVFETFRGGESAAIYARFVAVVARMFGADSFTIDPYQLGHGNAEGQASGVWWFYFKFGFRPREPEILERARRERRRMRIDPGYRTPPAGIHALAADSMDFSMGRRRDDVLGRLSPGNVGLAASRLLAEGYGADRERGLRACSREASRLLGSGPRRAWTAGERRAWERWSPLVLALPGVSRWPAADRRRLAAVIRAKGGRSELDYVRLFDGHRRLRRAIVRLSDAQ